MRYPFLKNFGRYPVIPVVLGRSSASRKKQAGGGLSRAPVRRRRGPLTGRCLLARLNSRRASVDYKRVRGREDAPDSKGGRRLWWGCRGEALAPRRACGARKDPYGEALRLDLRSQSPRAGKKKNGALSSAFLSIRLSKGV